MMIRGFYFQGAAVVMVSKSAEGQAAKTKEMKQFMAKSITQSVNHTTYPNFREVSELSSYSGGVVELTQFVMESEE